MSCVLTPPQVTPIIVNPSSMAQTRYGGFNAAMSGNSPCDSHPCPPPCPPGPIGPGNNIATFLLDIDLHRPWLPPEPHHPPTDPLKFYFEVCVEDPDEPHAPVYLEVHSPEPYWEYTMECWERGTIIYVQPYPEWPVDPGWDWAFARMYTDPNWPDPLYLEKEMDIPFDGAW